MTTNTMTRKPIIEPRNPEEAEVTKVRPWPEVEEFFIDQMVQVAQGNGKVDLEYWDDEEDAYRWLSIDSIDQHPIAHVVDGLGVYSAHYGLRHSYETQGVEGAPALNVPLLKQAIEFAAREHEQASEIDWMQEVWAQGDLTSEEVVTESKRGDIEEQTYSVVCPTACCIAGWATHAIGAPMVIDLSPYSDSAIQSMTAHGTLAVTDAVDPITGKVDYIEQIAQDQIGLLSGEADALFDGDNDIDHVIAVARTIAFARFVEPSEIA